MKLFLIISGISGFLSVALGAFGAHALKDRLSEYSIGVFQTGVQYQMHHTLAILAVAILIKFYPQMSVLKTSGLLFTAGIFIFSGSLYILSISGIKWLGAITPIGGLCFLVGWLLLVWAAVKIA